MLTTALRPNPLRTRRTLVAGSLLALYACAPAVQAAGAERILGPLPVSKGSPYVAQTPVVARDGTVYVATMEVGPTGDRRMGGDMRTVVRKGVESSPGRWSWTSTTIDDRTVADTWHNAASVGLDESGHLHVAYNMHNLPWQYVVSSEPGSIDAFDFRGQAITQAELDRYSKQNRTSFPSLGSADIPGNQITYPAFENDRTGRLHISYRFAAKPARAWDQRTLSTGLARYDVGSRTWAPLGGLLEFAPGDEDGSVVPPNAPRAIAGQTGWTSYLPRVTFGPDNAPTVSTLWRNGGPGALVTAPCTLKSDASGTNFTGLDGSPVSSPASPGDCPPVSSADGSIGYNTIGDAAADSKGNHHLLLSPVNGQRAIHSWTGSGWTSEPAPGAAVEIFFDAADNLWAIATGPAVYVKRAGESNWRNVLPRTGRECFPHASLDRDGATAYVFTLGCDSSNASVTKLDLGELLGTPIVPVPGWSAAPAAPVAAAPDAGDGVDTADAGDTDGGDASDGGETDPVVADGGDSTADDRSRDEGGNGGNGGSGTSGSNGNGSTGGFGLPPLGYAANGPLVLPRLEWRPFTLPESSVGMTPAAVFAELAREEYGRTWTLFVHDVNGGRYFVPGIDEPLVGGGRYWAIQDGEVVVVVESARGVFSGS